MKYLDLTFPTPEENLACDEALLECGDAGGPEVLRFWTPRHHCVVVGYSNSVEREVHVEACRKRNVPILRRCTGGGTVLQGPGCLNFSLILRMDSHPALQTVIGTNRFVMERNRAALENLLVRSNRHGEALFSKSEIGNRKSEISVRGHTDLARGDRKFSGNAQRRRHRAVLFHGTILLNLDLSLVGELLPMPSKHPDYRHNRDHAEFLMNLGMPEQEMKDVLRRSWKAAEVLKVVPVAEIRKLADQKYATEAWNLKF